MADAVWMLAADWRVDAEEPGELALSGYGSERVQVATDLSCVRGRVDFCLNPDGEVPLIQRPEDQFQVKAFAWPYALLSRDRKRAIWAKVEPLLHESACCLGRGLEGRG